MDNKRRPLTGIDIAGRIQPPMEVTIFLFCKSHLKVVSFTRVVYTAFFPPVIIQNFNAVKRGSPANDFCFYILKIYGTLMVLLTGLHTNVFPNSLFILCNIKNIYQSKHDYIQKTFHMSHRATFFDLRQVIFKPTTGTSNELCGRKYRGTFFITYSEIKWNVEYHICEN